MIKTIVLDFGHGGLDKSGRYTTGTKKMHTFSETEIAYEGVINRQIGKRLQRKLAGTNLNIITTVDADDPTDVSLGNRVRTANKQNPKETILISIHSNAFNTRVRGFELFTSKGLTESDKIAESIADEVEQVYKELNLKLRYDLSDGDKDKEADFYVLRKSKCPAVLIECLFFDNYEDYKHLTDVYFQERLAIAIYKGIINYVT